MALNPRILKAGLGLLAVCLAAYILGPPLYWQFKEGLASVKHSSSSSSSSPYTTSSAISCRPCHCDCSAQSLPSIPQGLSNNSFADCAKHDPDVSADTEKNFVELLSEELKLREAEALENQQRADMQLLEAKKMTSQYQKEADKCNSGMETCEAAREKSEAALVAQKKTHCHVGDESSSKRMERRHCKVSHTRKCTGYVNLMTAGIVINWITRIEFVFFKRGSYPYSEA